MYSTPRWTCTDDDALIGQFFIAREDQASSIEGKCGCTEL